MYLYIWFWISTEVSDKNQFSACIFIGIFEILAKIQFFACTFTVIFLKCSILNGFLLVFLKLFGKKTYMHTNKFKKAGNISDFSKISINSGSFCKFLKYLIVHIFLFCFISRFFGKFEKNCHASDFFENIDENVY